MGVRRGASLRSGEIQVHEAAPWDPWFTEHMPDGTPIARSRAHLAEWAAFVNDRTGRKIRVNPDGGPPSAEDLRQSRLEDRRRVEERKAARRRRKDQDPKYQRWLRMRRRR